MTVSGALLMLALTIGGAAGAAMLSSWIAAWRGLRPPAQTTGLAAMGAPFARGARLLTSPTRRLAKPDELLWRSGPILVASSALLAFAVIPLGPEIIPIDLSLGLFYFIVILGPLMVGFMNAGWGVNGKFDVVATFRAAAHIVAYEVTFGFAVLGAPMMAQTLSTVGIVDAQQRVWFAVLQPGSFAIYVVSALFIAYRHPFDLPFGGPEIAGGVGREYGGIERAIFVGARHALLGATVAIGVVVFLGGWLGPVLPAPLWFVLKAAVLMGAFTALPLVLPRLRLDQMLTVAWKGLLPLSLANIVVVGLATFPAAALGWIP